jgi:putative ABC transport system permease protein
VLHVALADGVEPRRAIAELEGLLEDHGLRVEGTLPVAVLRGAVADHMKVLVAVLVALAVLMAVVGTLGLASSMSINVFERTREIGVLRAIGASPARVLRLILGEGLITGVLSLPLSLPLSAGIATLIGQMAFRTPLPLAVAVGGALGWVALVVLGSLAATLVPARRAARMTSREALAYE